MSATRILPAPSVVGFLYSRLMVCTETSIKKAAVAASSCQTEAPSLPVHSARMSFAKVPGTGFEPAHLAAPPPEDGASTNFATRAKGCKYK